MYTARKNNRVIDIDPSKVKEFVGMGYTVTNEEGKVVGEPETFESIKKERDALKKELEILKAKQSKKTVGKEASE